MILAQSMLSDLLGDSTTPLILISGIAILLLVINARIMHVIDRIRSLAALRAKASGQEEQSLAAEIKILVIRARILRASIVSLCTSVFSSSLLLLCAVLETIGQGSFGVLGVVLLLLSALGVTVSAGTLLGDVVLTLQALRKQLEL